MDDRLVDVCRAAGARPGHAAPRRCAACAGYAVDIADWRDASVDWSTARVTVLRSPWDYVDHHDEFVAWAERVDAVSSLWNPLALVRWNTHKAYLLDLHERGAPVVPTVVLLGGSAASLDGICDAQGWNSVVVKPAVASGGKGARASGGGRRRGAGASRRSSDARRCARAAVRARRSNKRGEWSVVLVDGRVSVTRCASGPREVTTGCRRSGAARTERGRAERGSRRARNPRVRRAAGAGVCTRASTSFRSASSGTSWRSR